MRFPKIRAIPLILVGLAGALMFGTAGSSYIYRTDTQRVYTFQDTLSPLTPWPAGYKGIEDAMLTGGNSGSKKNWGLSELARIGVSSAVAGVHRLLVRHDPFYFIDSTNVAAWDSVVVTFTTDTTPVISPHVDTLYCFGIDETRWSEGTGTGNAADTLGVSGTCFNSRAPGFSADSTWGAFRAGKSDSTYFTGISTVRADSFPGLVNYDAIYYGGRIVQGTTDRMPFPAAIKLSNNLLTPAGSAFTWNITNAVLWQLKRNQPLNVLFSMRCDTTGVKATYSGATQDSVPSQKLDIRSSDYVAVPASRPILKYYVRLKRLSPMVGN